ncbi:DNA invertase Pin-like site-specific DNA recombinase [Planomicrobium soli]|uniref:DNA invertase Pin-like site-specific DNA recombinase n=1 Tax=Planomicrobium soli TaxID=1176648 RepID=A0A2P8H4K4_9BACL|nr:recombinase family protein [Planomicrobium soli]PSL41151.1 DNA invertase Pin-like site-specific DNA recombinase [Planomicrobium soli]
MNKKAAIYTRVSTKKYSQSKSMIVQEEHYIDYCERAGYELVGLYAEKGLTGTNARRPEFIRMLHDAGLDYVKGNDQGKDRFILSKRRPKFNYIVVKDPSRFSRSASIGLDVIEDLRTKGVYVVFENSGYSSDSSNWHFNMSMLFTVAQNESHNMSRRIMFSKRHMANKGEYKPARPALGYVRNKNNEIVIEPDHAEIVKYIFNRYLEVGSSIIAKELNEKGLTSQTGVRFSPDKINRIIINPVYYGSPVVNRTKKYSVTDVKREKNDKADFITIPNAVEPIVSEELWRETNMIRESRINKSSKRGRKTAKNDVFYSKLICSCGSRMVRHTGEKEKITYICQSRRKAGSCNTRSIAITVLNRFMRQIDLSFMTNTLGDSIYYKKLIEKLENQKLLLNKTQQIIRKEIEKLNLEIEDIIDKYMVLEDSDKFKQRLKDRANTKEEEIAELEKKLIEINIIAIEQVRQKVINKKEMIETIFRNKNFTQEEKLNLLKKVEVSNYELTFHFSLPSYEEEIEEYNELFSMAMIVSDIPHNPFSKETFRREHKAAREHWKALDEEYIVNEEYYNSSN